MKEVLFGQSTEGVGRTNAVTGSLNIAGSTVEKGDFTVDMTTVTSDSGNRDNQFQGRIMDTSKFPTSTFTLTQPIELGSVPAEGQTVTASATGDLTLRGTTKSVTFDVQSQLKDGKIEVNGTIPIVVRRLRHPQPQLRPGVDGGQRRAGVPARLHEGLTRRRRTEGRRARATSREENR